MARRPRDYAAEYRARVRGTAPGTAARAAARGHRGPADAERAIKARDTVSISTAVSGRDSRGRVTEQTIFVDKRDGTTVAYVIRRRGDTDAARRRFTADLRGVARAINTSDAPYVQGTPVRRGAEPSSSYLDELMEEEAS